VLAIRASKAEGQGGSLPRLGPDLVQKSAEFVMAPSNKRTKLTMDLSSKK
jgi:hypothetical protein